MQPSSRHPVSTTAAAASAVALANLDLIERESLLDESARLEKVIAAELTPLTEHPAVAEVRCGTGALAAVQLADGSRALSLATGLRRHGVSTRAVGAGAIQISPAFVMTDEQVADLAAGIRAGLDDLVG